MKVKICPNCGTHNSEDSTKCGCGVPLRSIRAVDEKSSRSESPKVETEHITICPRCSKEIPFGAECDCQNKPGPENGDTESYYLTDFGNSFRIEICNNSDLVLGRGYGGSEYFAEKSYVSNRHIKMFRNGDMILITDLSSRNGTLVNGQSIKPEVPFQIYSGDKITLGAKERQDAINKAAYLVLKKD